MQKVIAAVGQALWVQIVVLLAISGGNTATAQTWKGQITTSLDKESYTFLTSQLEECRRFGMPVLSEKEVGAWERSLQLTRLEREKLLKDSHEAFEAGHDLIELAPTHAQRKEWCQIAHRTMRDFINKHTPK